MGQTETQFVIYKDRAGRWRWRYLAQNHKIMGDSGEGYNRKSDAKRAISRIISSIINYQYNVIEK